MSKTGLLLFARIESDDDISSEINGTIQSFKQLNTELDIHLIAFGPSSKNITISDVNFTFDQSLDITLFQKIVCSKLDFFLSKGYNKTIIGSCSYQINNTNFLDKNLLIVNYDEKDFNENKNINHRFIYGRTSLLKRIWENKPFDTTKDLDKNLFLNVFNVIGINKMNENRVEMKNFITRVGWVSK